MFTDTAKTIPPKILKFPTCAIWRDGIFLRPSTALPKTVEHSQPDYDLYAGWLQGRTGANLKYYTDYSVGFLTRGCSRRCPFCINRNARKATNASPLKEFYNPNRKHICLLDDNILAYKESEALLTDLICTCERDGKTFEIKQGIDIRLLTPKIAMLFQAAPYQRRDYLCF